MDTEERAKSEREAVYAAMPAPAGFSAGSHDGALFTPRRSTGKNFANGAKQPLCEWFHIDQMRAFADATHQLRMQAPALSDAEIAAVADKHWCVEYDPSIDGEFIRAVIAAQAKR